MLRFLTAGESHGKSLVVVVDGVPSGLRLSAQDIDDDLHRRQIGYGRGGRMNIEDDKAEIISGLRAGMTIGSPIAISIKNKDWENWQEVMSQEKPIPSEKELTKPRPGHADLAGGIKYHHRDLRNVLERASARETAARVAVGAIAKRILDELDIFIISLVTSIGECFVDPVDLDFHVPVSREYVKNLKEQLDRSPLRCPSVDVERCMMQAIDLAKQEGDSLGGTFRVVAFNVPTGLGSYTQWDRRLDARLAYAIMSIPAVKGVEIGQAFDSAKKKGSQVHDEIFFSDGRFYRQTNNAGGIEGGVSNGEAIYVNAAMKPIPTLMKPLRSVDIVTKEQFLAFKERSDVCAVPSAAIVGEAMVAIEIANALMEKFGGDNMSEIKSSFQLYKEYVSKRYP